jgi:hypothetical protein
MSILDGDESGEVHPAPETIDDAKTCTLEKVNVPRRGDRYEHAFERESFARNRFCVVPVLAFEFIVALDKRGVEQRPL